jgi:hypothetical protein
MEHHHSTWQRRTFGCETEDDDALVGLNPIFICDGDDHDVACIHESDRIVRCTAFEPMKAYSADGPGADVVNRRITERPRGRRSLSP